MSCVTIGGRDELDGMPDLGPKRGSASDFNLAVIRMRTKGYDADRGSRLGQCCTQQPHPKRHQELPSFNPMLLLLHSHIASRLVDSNRRVYIVVLILIQDERPRSQL
jgi:hypothetical protein